MNPAPPPPPNVKLRRPPRYHRTTRRTCCTSCRMANYSLLVLGVVEAFIILYYVITIIVVSYIYGKYYVPNQDRHRRYWTSLLAVRYFVLFSLFGFPVSLMTRKCRPMVIYGIKNVGVAAYALTSSVSSIVILTTTPVRGGIQTPDDDPVLRMMRVFGIVDSAINVLCATAEIWFIFLALNFSRHKTKTADWIDEEEQTVNNQSDPQNLQKSEPSSGDLLQPPQESTGIGDTMTHSPSYHQCGRRNAMTNDIVSVLLGKV